MNREKVLKIFVGTVETGLYSWHLYLTTPVRIGWQANKKDAEPMAHSLDVTMGFFLLMAAGNPSANRGVIAFAAWMNIAHGGVMAVHLPNEREDLLIAAAVFSVIGTALIVLAPAMQSGERASSAAAQAGTPGKQPTRTSRPTTSQGGVRESAIAV